MKKLKLLNSMLKALVIAGLSGPLFATLFVCLANVTQEPGWAIPFLLTGFIYNFIFSLRVGLIPFGLLGIFTFLILRKFDQIQPRATRIITGFSIAVFGIIFGFISIYCISYLIYPHPIFLKKFVINLAGPKKPIDVLVSILQLRSPISEMGFGGLALLPLLPLPSIFYTLSFMVSGAFTSLLILFLFHPPRIEERININLQVKRIILLFVAMNVLGLASIRLIYTKPVLLQLLKLYAKQQVERLNSPDYRERIAALSKLDSLDFQYNTGTYVKAYTVKSLLTVLRTDRRFEVQRKAISMLSRVKNPQIVEPISAILNYSDFAFKQRGVAEILRIDAARALGRMDDPRATEALIGALIHESAPVRKEAAESLGRQKDPLAVAPLIYSMNDTDKKVRIYAMVSLGRIGDYLAVGSLILASQDEDPEIRKTAEAALDKIKTSQIKRTYEGVHPRVTEELKKMNNPQAINVRFRAAWSINEIKDSSLVEPITEALKNKDADARILIAKGLKDIENPLAVDFLIAFLEDENEYVLSNVISGLNKKKDPRAVEPLAASLKNVRWLKGREIIKALSNIDDPFAVDALTFAVADKALSKYVRKEAAKQLGRLNDPRAVEALINVFNDKDAPDDLKSNVGEALTKIDHPDAVNAISNLFEGEDSRIPSSVIESLVEKKDSRAVGPLINYLNDEDYNRRWWAARQLGYAGDPRAVEPLINALKDENVYVRASAAESLGWLKDPRAVEPLIAALNDEEKYVKLKVKNALAMITGQDFGRDPVKWNNWWRTGNSGNYW